MDFTRLDTFLDSLLTRGLPLYDCIVHVHHKEVYRRRGGKVGAPYALYYLYSASKPVTCAAALTLVEAGRLHLCDPVSYYLPEYADVEVTERLGDGRLGRRPPKSPIRVRDLFAMTAGLHYNLDCASIREAVAATGGRAPTREIARALAKEPLSFDPGERWQYSLCHDVLAALTEEVAGIRFSEYVRRAIFDPLGMTHSGYHLRPGDMLTQQYRYNDQTGRSETTENTNIYVFGEDYDSGGAGMISCAEDYILFADALACGGVGKTGARILSPATIELMRTNVLNPRQAATFNWSWMEGYGYGLGVRTIADRFAAGSIGPDDEFGWGGAAGALVYIAPKSGTAIYLAQHALNPHEERTLGQLRNVAFACLDS